MCIFIAGLQPRTRTVDDTPRRCPRCGLFQARMQQTDHYISLFFIPLIPVRRGEPYLYCPRCQLPVAHDGISRPDARPSGQDRCPHCSGRVVAGFQYCPQCGQRL